MSADAFTAPLVPLPNQPSGLAWPTDEWPTGEAPERVQLDVLLDELFDDTRPGTDRDTHIRRVAV